MVASLQKSSLKHKTVIKIGKRSLTKFFGLILSFKLGKRYYSTIAFKQVKNLLAMTL